MEVSPSSERAAAVGGDDGRDPVRDGVRVDGKRYPQRVRKGKCQRGSVWTCMFFVQGLYLHLSLTITWLP